MPKYNIYKIKKSKEQDMIKKLEQVGLVKTYQERIDNMNCTFYFSSNPTNKPVHWVALYQDFLSKYSESELSNQNYFGAFILRDDYICYVVSLGKTHFYLKEFCHLDFGIEMGMRIIDKNSIDLKNSRLFGGNRKKSIVSYQSNTSIELDSGEAITYLKGKTVSDTWGRKVSCGNSVHFSVKNLKPVDLPVFVKRIEEKLQDEKLFEIPSSQEVREKQTIDQLDRQLVENIRNNQSMISMEEQFLSGVEFIFLKDCDLKLKVKGGWEAIDPDISMEDFNLLLEKNEIELEAENLDNIKIRASTESGSVFTNNIRHYVDFVDEEYHFLQDGKWYRFNQTYIDFLEEAVDSIHFHIRHEHNFNTKDFKRFMSGLSETEKKKWYAERYFNEVQMRRHGFKNFDRDIGKYDKYKMEFTDLYKDDTLYFVKMGTPQKLGYVIDQSLATVNYLVQNQREIYIGDDLLKPKNICLWLILERKTEIEKITDLRSFIFLIKINEWRRTIENANYNPQIVISYKK